MIFYFTGCGNSLLAAQRIARQTHDRLIQLPTAQKEFELAHGENIGLITPVYFFGLPTIVCDFLTTAHFTGLGNNYVFTVCTYGTTSGMASHQLSTLFKSGGLKVDAQYSVKMVDVYTPMFNLTNPQRTLHTTQLSLPKISQIAQNIATKATGNHDQARLWHPLASLYYKVYEKKRQTRHFHLLTQRCISCGLCAHHCPTQSITFDKGHHPDWTSPQCALCLRCLHHCPAFAIQYGRATIRHGQFVNPFVDTKNSKISSKDQ